MNQTLHRLPARFEAKENHKSTKPQNVWLSVVKLYLSHLFRLSLSYELNISKLMRMKLAVQPRMEMLNDR